MRVLHEVCESAATFQPCMEGSLNSQTQFYAIILSVTRAAKSEAMLLLPMQTWKTKIGGPTRDSYNLQTYYNESSYGKTQLKSFDVIGPIDMGSPSCCPSSCTPDNFNLQTIWDSASARGLNLASYGHTAIGWPSMHVAWAGLALVHCYGDYTCWACVPAYAIWALDAICTEAT